MPTMSAATKAGEAEVPAEHHNPMQSMNEMAAGRVSRPSITEEREVIRLRDVIRCKIEFDGVRELFKFLFFVVVCACIPLLFLDKGSILSGSDVLEAITGEWSYDNYYLTKSGSYTDVGNAQEMLTYAAGLQRTLLEDADEYGYPQNEVYVKFSQIKATELYFSYAPSLTQTFSDVDDQNKKLENYYNSSGFGQDISCRTVDKKNPKIVPGYQLHPKFYESIFCAFSTFYLPHNRFVPLLLLSAVNGDAPHSPRNSKYQTRQQNPQPRSDRLLSRHGHA